MKKTGFSVILSIFKRTDFTKIVLNILCACLALSIPVSSYALIFKSRGLSDYPTAQNISYSSDKKNVIFTICDSEGTQMLLVSTNGQLEVKLTDEFIKFSPVINNEGTFAYAKSEFSTSQSKVYLNNSLIPITDDSRLYNNLNINEHYLVFSCSDFSSDQNIIYILDLHTKHIIEKRMNNMFIQKLKLIGNKKILIELYDTNSLSRKVLSMNIDSGKVSYISSSLLTDSFIYEVGVNGNYVIANVKGDRDLKSLFNAFHILNSASKNSDFSYSNNFMGRITWNESYRLYAMTNIWSITGDTTIKKVISNTAHRIVSRMNANNGMLLHNNPEFGWATTKYSYDKTTPISLIVDDSLIHYSLLNAVRNEAIIETRLKNSIIHNAQMYFEYQEQYFDFEKSLYRIPHGIEFWADGVIAPFNWQNAFGLMLIELYNLTGSSEYKLRTIQLAEAFHRELEYTSDNRLLWYYWPAVYYDGWAASSRTSKNTPDKEASTNNLYEDFSHAGQNVKFIVEYSQYIDDNLFRNYKFLLNNTLDNMIKDNNTFSRFMDGFTDLGCDFQYLPKFGWSELNNMKLGKLYENLLPYLYPEFDSLELAVAYVKRIEDIDINQKISVEFFHFNEDDELVEKNSVYYDINNYKDFFETYQ